MLAMNKIPTQIDLVTGIVDMTFACNDTCAFCFNQKMLNKHPGLSKEEIINKCWAVKNKWGLDQIILSGGEPMMHENFWDIFGFFLNDFPAQISLNTNSLLLTDPHRVKKMKDALSSARNKERMFSLSLSSVDHFPAQTAKEKLKLAGVRAAIRVAEQTNTDIIIVIAITKTNYRIVPDLITWLGSVSKGKMVISLRGLYLDRYMSVEQKQKTLPVDWIVIRPFAIQAIRNVLRYKRFQIRLFNLPLCYFRDELWLDRVVGQTKRFFHEIRIGIRKGVVLKAGEFHKDTWLPPECISCPLSGACSKIQPEFIQKYNYPELRSI